MGRTLRYRHEMGRITEDSASWGVRGTRARDEEEKQRREREGWLLWCASLSRRVSEECLEQRGRHSYEPERTIPRYSGGVAMVAVVLCRRGHRVYVYLHERRVRKGTRGGFTHAHARAHEYQSFENENERERERMTRKRERPVRFGELSSEHAMQFAKWRTH